MRLFDSLGGAGNSLGSSRGYRASFGGFALAGVLALLAHNASAAATLEDDRPYLHQHEHEGDALQEKDFRHAPKDLVLWGELARTRVVRGGGRLTPTFLPSVLALDGKTVSLLGFMAPVKRGKAHTQFLLSDKRFLCDRCESSPPPASIVEVNTQVGEPLRDRPIWVRGKLQLVKDSPNGLVYRLNAAKVIRRLK